MAGKKKATAEVKVEAAVSVIELSEEVVVAVEPAVSTLSSALSEKVSTDYFTTHTITLVIKDNFRPQVKMDGFWDGMLLKSAIRSIEREYHVVRKHSAINAMKQAQDKSKQQLTTEATK